jgi:hypothetical protein
LVSLAALAVALSDGESLNIGIGIGIGGMNAPTTPTSTGPSDGGFLNLSNGGPKPALSILFSYIENRTPKRFVVASAEAAASFAA